MSRLSDSYIQAPVKASQLPRIDWVSIGAPVTPSRKGPDKPLLSADSHLFLHGFVQGESESTTLINKWLQYSNPAFAGWNHGGPFTCLSLSRTRAVRSIECY